MDKRTVIELPGGRARTLASALKNVIPSRLVRTRRSLIEIEATLPNETLIKIRLLYPDVVIKERSREGERILRGEKIEWVEDIVHCSNRNCITAQPREPARKRLKLVSLEPLKLQCYYCGRYAGHEDILDQLRAKT